MPYINVNTSVRLTEEKKEQLKSALGKTISLIPGKTESSLMVGICDNYDIYMGGTKKENAAFVAVKIYGTASREAKASISSKLFNIFDELLEIGPNDLYITFGEHLEWGARGKLL